MVTSRSTERRPSSWLDRSRESCLAARWITADIMLRPWLFALHCLLHTHCQHTTLYLSIQVYKTKNQRVKLKVRYYLMLDCTDEDLIEPYLQNGPEIDPDSWLTVRAIKVFQDGSLGTRSALMLEPYSDAQDILGVSTTSKEEIEELTTRSL